MPVKMVVDTYKHMINGIKDTANLANIKPPGYKTDLSVNLFVYHLSGWLSVAIGGLMLLEEYAMRRIHCLEKSSPAIEEYCWHHGVLARADTATQTFWLIPQGWLFQVYIYFFVKAGIVMLPHIAWTLKFKNTIVATLKGTCDSISDLEESWIHYAEVSEQALRENTLTEEEVDGQDNTVIYNLSARAYNATIAMTQNVVQMTKQRAATMNSMLVITQCRIFYDMLVHFLFLMFDITILITAQGYSGTDLFCEDPTVGSSDKIRCMLPMVQILQQALIINLICACVVFAVLIGHAIWFCCSLEGKSTEGCFLESIPCARHISDLSWPTPNDRKSYKLLSHFLMQNFVILHPLSTMQSFVRSLQKNNLLGPQGDFILTLPREDLGVSMEEDTTDLARRRNVVQVMGPRTLSVETTPLMIIDTAQTKV